MTVDASPYKIDKSHATYQALPAEKKLDANPVDSSSMCLVVFWDLTSLS